MNFIPVGELEVTGLGARYRQAGLGAPLAAEMEPIDPEKADFLAQNARAPVTALLRVGNARAQLAQPTRRCAASCSRTPNRSARRNG